MAAGGGQISFKSLTISPAVLNLNIAIQHINKALPEVYGFYIRPEEIPHTTLTIGP